MRVTVKWGTKLVEPIEIDGDSCTAAEFKRKLEERTGVPVENQKVIGFKNGLLKTDETLLKDLGVKDDLKVMLVGIARSNQHSLLTRPQTLQQPLFIEEMTPAQQSRFMNERPSDPLPVGLVNLGNTCYLNAVMQLLRKAEKAVHQILSIKADKSNASIATPLEPLMRQFQDFYRALESSPSRAVTPFGLVNAIRSQWPQFASRSSQGDVYAQQDAEEYLSAILAYLCEQLRSLDELFGFEVENRLTLKEAPAEAAAAAAVGAAAEPNMSSSTERSRILRCFTTNQLPTGKPIDNLMQGIMLAFDEEITKHHAPYGRDALFHRISRLASLPEYLIVQFVRFEWKGANALTQSSSSKTKVCRRVQYPFEFDVYPIASETLQNELSLARRVWHGKKDPSRTTAPSDARTPVGPQGEGAQDSTGRDQAIMSDDNAAPDEADLVTADMCAGHYDLVGCVSHKGRTADSGHYVAWIKKNEDIWWMFDDDRVSEVKIKDIDLSGGRSDYHISIILLYQKRYFQATAAEVSTAVAESDNAVAT